MKKLLLVIVFWVTILNGFCQNATSSSALKKMSDSICDCLSKKDLSHIQGADSAKAVYESCIFNYYSLLVNIAEERNIEITDRSAMLNFGIELAKELVRNNCSPFIQLSQKMVDKDKSDLDGLDIGATGGKLLRIETKDFSYLIMADKSGRENSFIWLHYFPNSERFMENTKDYIGKYLEIKWKETEVYLPSAKGYYKIKEITDINVQ